MRKDELKEKVLKAALLWSKRNWENSWERVEKLKVAVREWKEFRVKNRGMK